MRIDWDEINTVLLDMDGTLIDRHYEDYFWGVMLPRMLAKKRAITLNEAREEVNRIAKEVEGTKNWGDIDFWERKLGMKLWKMRFDMKHMVKLHPHTVRFLKFLKKHNKKIYVISASPQPEIKFKIKTSGIADYFNGFYSETDFRESKYGLGFWKKLSKVLDFDPRRTLVADDVRDILKAAGDFGIKYLIFKSKNNSRKPAREPNEFIYVNHFDDILKRSEK